MGVLLGGRRLITKNWANIRCRSYRNILDRFCTTVDSFLPSSSKVVSLSAQAVFTTRGDVCHHDLAEQVGARLDNEGQIVVDHDMKTSVPGLYAAGYITSANCQMIIAAGQGATAGQAINRDLFEDSLQRHTLLCDACRDRRRVRSPMSSAAESIL